MPIQLHIQKMKREADVIKKNEKSANDYLTQTKFPYTGLLILFLLQCKYQLMSIGRLGENEEDVIEWNNNLIMNQWI